MSERYIVRFPKGMFLIAATVGSSNALFIRSAYKQTKESSLHGACPKTAQFESLSEELELFPSVMSSLSLRLLPLVMSSLSFRLLPLVMSSPSLRLFPSVRSLLRFGYQLSIAIMSYKQSGKGMEGISGRLYLLLQCLRLSRPDSLVDMEENEGAASYRIRFGG